jgi:hypothetical protein
MELKTKDRYSLSDDNKVIEVDSLKDWFKGSALSIASDMIKNDTDRKDDIKHDICLSIINDFFRIIDNLPHEPRA